jgi:hypothetical protein
VDKKQKIKLVKTLPEPEELEGFMPQMNQPRMLIELLIDNKTKIVNITLIALLMGTAKLLMKEVPDWQEYLRIPDSNELEGEEVDLPEPCGDPDCKGCAELQKAIDDAPPGTEVKMLRLTREQAEKAGIDVDEDVINISHAKPKNEVVH